MRMWHIEVRLVGYETDGTKWHQTLVKSETPGEAIAKVFKNLRIPVDEVQQVEALRSEVNFVP